MALTRTVRVGAASAHPFGTGAYTPAGQPFSPATGSILVAAVQVGFNQTQGAWNPTISDDRGDGGTWTQRVSVSVEPAGAWSSGIRVWTRPVITGGSMSISFDQGAVNVDGGYAASVIEYSGQDGTTPQFGAIAKTAAAVDGADSVTLTSAPALGDEVLGFLGREMNTGTATSTEGATFTELQDFCTSQGSGMQSEVRTASTSTTVDWADLNTAAGDVFRVHLAAIGIAVGATAPAAPTITSQAGGHTRAGVQWTAGADGGSAVTSWDIDHATAAAPTTWLGPTNTASTNLYGAVTGLTNGIAYVFRVRGVNAIGNGTWSSTSGSATPSDVRGSFLLESGDKFLLESGDEFLLEAGAGDSDVLGGLMFWGVLMAPISGNFDSPLGGFDSASAMNA